MKVEIDEGEVLEIVEKGVQERYGGDAMQVTEIKLSVNSPRGKTRYVTATGELVVKEKPIGSEAARPMGATKLGKLG